MKTKMKNNTKTVNVFAALIYSKFARSPNVSKLVGVFAPAFFQTFRQ
jgi:hypothetical protein